MLSQRMRKTKFAIRLVATSFAIFFAAELFTVASYAQAPPSYPPQELERLVSRIALYPDPLLAQILTASTYPNDIPDAAQWAEWGFDYLKYDWNPVELPQVVEMAGALRATKRDIILSLSNNSHDRLLDRIAEIAPFAQSWRTTGDISDSWGSLSGIGFSQEPWAPFSGPGHWNDPDMLVVGWVGWGPKLHQTKLTPDEQYTHISLWCLLSAPLLIGCDLEKLDAFTLSLLSNDEVLAVDQDALGKQAVRVAGENDLDVFAKPLENGSLAVGLFNRSATNATVTANFSDLKISGKQTVRDLWRQKDIGVFTDKFEVPVASHGVVLVRLIPGK